MESLKQGPPDPAGTFLTERQVQVLHLRGSGLSQKQVAERLGTTGANISLLEKRARRNLKKAHATLTLADQLQAPVHHTIPPGTDLYDVPGTIYAAADEAEIKVEPSGPEILRLAHREAGSKIRDRAVEAPLTVSVNRNGHVTIR